MAADAVSPLSPVAWGDAVWNLQVDPATGALVHLENRQDAQHMNWLREGGRWERRDWKPDTSTPTIDGQWGLVETAQTGPLHRARVTKLTDNSWEAVYTSAALTVTVRREIDASGDLAETYTFTNTGNIDTELPAGSASITAPLFDQYPDAAESLARRCHAHVWAGGASSWINAMRMGCAPPHLGLVVTQGSLESYSQRGGTFNDRGVFLLHPGAMRLKRGESATFGWKLFWHQGWKDFFGKVAAAPGFVRLTARDYTVDAGHPLQVSAESVDSLEGAKVFADGTPVETKIEGNRLACSIPATKPGDLAVTLEKDGRRSVLRAFVTPPLNDLVEARLKFIVRKQQRNAKGDPLGGAYLSYDNETGQQWYNPKLGDHNAGRERVCMGVLGALYLPLCKDKAFKAELEQSLRKYSGFIARELEGDDGVVYEEVGRKKSSRIYNFPWVADFHLAMYRATGDKDQLDRYVRVVRAFYATKEGPHFYPIGMPVLAGLQALEQAGRTADRAELLAKFRTHADNLAANGTSYPRHEVNFEQSIVAPAVQMLAEMHLVTGDKRYLEGAKAQMPVLENFAGKQPDSRLNEISIRHWDDYWVGKTRVYGDTLPHYWSTINALAYAYYGMATKDPSWLPRAETVVRGNLSLFTPEGAGSCAHLYADDTNGKRGATNDVLANDQDWALVNALKLRALAKSSPEQ